MNEEIIKTKLEELSKELDGQISFHICADKYSTHKKIEIVYDRKKR